MKKKQQQPINNTEQFTLAPASKPQEDFLKSESTITLYAGSAGKLVPH